MTKVSAHEGLGTLPNALKELWVEIGGTCHLKCDYCFAESDGIDNDPENVPMERMLETIEEFKKMGGERIGVVGAGEPLHPKNREDLFDILNYTEVNDITTTIFTTGDLITENVLDKLDNYKNITLLIKYNSQIPEVQDKLARNDGYTLRRKKALKTLFERGYNDGKKLGIVTSIMEDNYDEMPDLLRYARDNNLIFDADTLISRGRGSTCGLNSSDEKNKTIVEKLQKIDKDEYGKEWIISGNYIASPPCTRFCQHLYINKTGDVYPCVGSSDVVLGNIKEQSLEELWDSPLMKMIREHRYEGECTTCENYQNEDCYSCLGRSTEDLNTESLKRDGYVKTIGCFNYRSANNEL
ncbi:MAG: radical SAM protein [Nanoarchaeota archaeon]|nr:radical SAM protein [Nanoarchaeota archaeon]MBU1135583.1 radical SAM protein [Nanoarchaeota archaeon]MBU2520361.1 radical SAM protein [Nanoarchaeota archaeon]